MLSHNGTTIEHAIYTGRSVLPAACMPSIWLLLTWKLYRSTSRRLGSVVTLPSRSPQMIAAVSDDRLSGLWNSLSKRSGLSCTTRSFTA